MDFFHGRNKGCVTPWFRGSCVATMLGAAGLGMKGDYLLLGVSAEKEISAVRYNHKLGP